MKGIIFSIKRPERKKRRKRLTLADIKYYMIRYGVQAFSVFVLLLGLAFGAVYASSADGNMISSLDFLFTTNLEARLSQGAVGTFCACFASNSVFLFTVFFLGLAPWGIPVLPLVLMFKGFGTGVTAGYLFMSYSIKGAVFYLLVLLPGTFLFCMALIIFASNAFGASKRMLLHTIGRNSSSDGLKKDALRLCSVGLSALIMSFLSAILDTVLWVVFAGMFNF